MSCPYFEERNYEKCCKASVSAMSPTLEIRNSKCLTDDYDFCAFFLAHILRHGSRKPNIRREIAV